MSEPASLYARFTLSHEQYEAFMNSAPARPAAFDDWQSWFDRRAIAGEGLAEARLLADDAVVLHPGPMLRGMEIGYSVADSAQAAILQQVNNGVHVRMAVLFRLLVGTDSAGAQ